MLYVPYRATKRVSGVVGGDRETIEGRREG